MNNKVARYSAIISTIIFAGMSVFQLLLVLGYPYGKAAWGGNHETLPTSLRIGSGIAIIVFGIASYLVLSRAKIITDFDKAKISRYGVLVLAVLFSLNTIMNLVSKSMLEKVIMTPIALVLSVCCFILFFNKA